MILYKMTLKTPLGTMIALSDDNALYLLEFIERKKLEWEIARLQKNIGATLLERRSAPLDQIEQELSLYFKAKLPQFHTPLALVGTPFQKSVWQELQKIPLGTTKSYQDLALALNKPTAARAVAQANASNQLALIIPCHRVINSTGAMGGYAAGVDRKQWLLTHEKTFLD